MDLVNHMETNEEVLIGKPPGRGHLPIYLLLTATLLLAILIAGSAFWEHYSRQDSEVLANQYYQPAARLLLRMVEETNRLNERLLDDAWSGRALHWDKAFRARHYDHLLIIRKNFDSLLDLENRLPASQRQDKERQLRSIEGRLLALEEEWAGASIVTSLVFHEFATRELPILAKELTRLRILQEEAARTLLDRLETELAFELQILTSSMAVLLLLAWWGTRRGFWYVRQTKAYQVRLVKALEKSREELALLGRTARCFSWVMEPTGTQFKQVDDGLMTWLGHQAQVWVGLEEWAAAIHEEDRERAVNARSRIVAGETEDWAFEYRLLTATGEEVWLRDVQVMRPGEGGGVYRGFFQDITHEKGSLLQQEARFAEERMVQEAEAARLALELARLEASLSGLNGDCARLEGELTTVQGQWQEAEARLSAILDHAQVAITLKDPKGVYLLVNRRFAEWFDVTAEALLGETDALLFPEEIALEIALRERMVLEDGQPQFGNEVLPMGDAKGLFSVVRFPSRSITGEVLGVFAILVDVTERKILEEELLGEVHLAKMQVRNAGRAQTRLLAAMGHEVPSLVRGMVRMIQRLQESGPPLRQQGRLDLLAQSAVSLLAVVEALRHGLHQKDGMASPGENFDLLAILEESAGVFSRYALGAGKRLQGRIALGVPRGVSGDAERLRRLLAILLGSAIHAVSRGEVLFSVQSHPQDVYRILFQVPAGNADRDLEDDLAVLERLAGDMGGGCRLETAWGGDGVQGTAGVISVFVQLSAPLGNEDEPMDDEPVDEMA